MIHLQDWVATIPPEDKLIAYVGEHQSVTRQFFLPDLAYKDYAFYLDLAFDLSTVTSTAPPRKIETTQQSASEEVTEGAVSVSSTAYITKESYTQADTTVDCNSSTDIAPLTKLVQKDGVLLTWTVVDQHTQLPGLLRATVRAVSSGGTVKKSSMMVFYVSPSVAATPAAAIPMTEYELMEKAMELELRQAAEMTLAQFDESLREAVGTVDEFNNYVNDRFNTMYDDLRCHATPDEPGMVFVPNDETGAREGGGIFGNSRRILSVVSATKEAIDARENEHCPIVPANLDYAVRSVGDYAYADKQTFDALFGLVQNLDVREATPDEIGMVLAANDEQQATESGIIAAWPHTIRTQMATEDMIAARANEHCPIVPANLEYAVKSVGDGYYAKVGDVAAPPIYEKIATVTVEADEDGSLPKYIIFSADSNGDAFELESFYVKALIGATDGSSARLTLAVNNEIVFGNASLGSVLSTTPRGWAMYYKDLGENEGALCIAQALAAGSEYPQAPSVNNASFTGGVVLPYMTQFKPVDKIDFYFTAGTAKTFTAGTKMELWGVRK
ncbi:MAG: hypothetical protein IJB26_03560 [Clostridia bacterium]|nr:hypothetical protein [Clostridia bacterium]